MAAHLSNRFPDFLSEVGPYRFEATIACSSQRPSLDLAVSGDFVITFLCWKFYLILSLVTLQHAIIDEAHRHPRYASSGYLFFLTALSWVCRWIIVVTQTRH